MNSRHRSEPTSTGGGCTRRWSIRRARTRFPTERPSSSSSRGCGSGRAEKVVYSKTLAEPRSARTRIERAFDPGAVRRLKADAERDLTVDGLDLAAQALRSGLVDEFQVIVCPVVVGGGKRFFPEGVRLELKLLGERSFDSGVALLRYSVEGY